MGEALKDGVNQVLNVYFPYIIMYSKVCFYLDITYPATPVATKSQIPQEWFELFDFRHSLRGFSVRS